MDAYDPDIFVQPRKRSPMMKVVDADGLDRVVAHVRAMDMTIVTTNGSFDLLHVGHMKSIRWSSLFADFTIVGINSDRSVRAYKGDSRPIIPQAERAYQVAAMECVDLVCIFDEDEVGGALIRAVRPDVHTTGSNWMHILPERAEVEEFGVRLEFVPTFKMSDRETDWSTTELIRLIGRAGE